MWIVYACLASLFAATAAIVAKIGVEGVNSNLVTAIITSVVLTMAWGMVFMTGVYREIPELSRRSLIFILSAGISTGLSWLFYYKALQGGPASKVVPIDKFSVVIALVLAFLVLKEPFGYKDYLGALLIGVGTAIMVL